MRLPERLENELEDIFNFEVVRGLLSDYLKVPFESVLDEEVNRIWEKCVGNPWNAIPVYIILKTKKESE